MKILVANLGSTSFKYRLLEMGDMDATEVATGGYERVTDYTECIGDMLESLIGGGHLASGDELDAVGFKTVLGKDLSGCVEADDRVLAALEGFNKPRSHAFKRCIGDFGSALAHAVDLQIPSTKVNSNVEFDVEVLNQFLVSISNGDFRHTGDFSHFTLRTALPTQH